MKTPQGMTPSHANLVAKVNRAVMQHIKKEHDSTEIVSTLLGALTAVIKSFPNQEHKEHFANQCMQKIAAAALEPTSSGQSVQ